MSSFMSKKGYYIGGSTVISRGRNPDWFGSKKSPGKRKKNKKKSAAYRRNKGKENSQPTNKNKYRELLGWADDGASHIINPNTGNTLCLAEVYLRRARTRDYKVPTRRVCPSCEKILQSYREEQSKAPVGS